MELHFPWVLEHTKEVTDVQWLIITGIGFLLITWLTLKFVWPGMIRPHLVQRQQSIAQSAEQVESTLRETVALRNDYVNRLQRIEDETEQRMNEAVAEAEALRERIVEEAKQTASALVRRGEEEVARERAKAMQHLRTQFIMGVIGAAKYAAARSLDAGHQRRLVDGFVKDLGAKS